MKTPTISDYHALLRCAVTARRKSTRLCLHEIILEWLFVPVMAAKAASSEFGPFTYDQVIRRDDWPEWEVAAEKEIDNLIAHDTFDLVDISEPMNQGAYVYNTKNVFTIKSETEPRSD